MATITNTIDPRKTPQQSRSRDTYCVILQAANELIDRSGMGEFNTNEIAKRAGVSVGSLYQYFPSKEAVLAALVRDMRQDMLNDFKLAIKDSEGQSFEAAIKALIQASLNHHLDNPNRTETLERVEEELPLDDETQQLKAEMSGLVVGLLRQNAIPLPEQTAFDIIAMSHGMVDAATRSGQTDFENLSLRLERAIFGYLGLQVGI